MMALLKQILTGKDNTTYDVVRCLGSLTVLNALGLISYAVVVHAQAFDVQSFGVGMGAVFGAIGAALKLKADTEPPA